MAITTGKAKELHARLTLTAAAIASSLAIMPAYAQQSGVTITGSASAEVIDRSVRAENLGLINETILTVRPQVNAFYQSRHFSGLFSGTVNHFDRELDTFGQRETFAQYSYNANYEVLENVFSIQANGALGYQNAFVGNLFATDFVNEGGELIKTRSNSLSGVVNVLNGDWVRGTGTFGYSRAKSETNPLFNNFSLDNEAYFAQGQIIQGDKIQNLAWRVQGSFQRAEQGQGAANIVNQNQGTFTNRILISDADLALYDRWALRATAQHEGNQLANRTETFRNVRQFNSYGAGVTYRVNEGRYISVTYNVVDSDIEEDDGDTFVGLDMQWAFTERTGLQARYTRRFFGESGNVNFNYNTKRFRSVLSYNEDVTNNALLIANPVNLGVFVCPAGETSIAQCFQPNSLNYQPQAGENLVQFGSQALEINDNIILRKAGTSQIGYSFSRLTVGLFGNYAEETFLEADTVRRTLATGMDLSYRIGSYTNITSRIIYADIIAQGDPGDNALIQFQPGEIQNWNANVGVNTQIGKNVNLNLNFSYLDQSSDIEQRGIFGGNFKDRRLTLGITYRYQ